MKKTNKVLSLILAVIMVLCMLPVSLFPPAEADELTNGTEFYHADSRLWYRVENLHSRNTYVVEVIPAQNSEVYSGTYNIPGSFTYSGFTCIVDEIRFEAFKGSDITSLHIDRNSAVSQYIIASNAFDGCTKLSKVTFGAGFMNTDLFDQISADAFASCTALEEIIIPSGFGYIGMGAFENCTALNKVICEYPYSSSREIQGSAFDGCNPTVINKYTDPANVRWEGTTAKWDGVDTSYVRYMVQFNGTTAGGLNWKSETYYTTSNSMDLSVYSESAGYYSFNVKAVEPEIVFNNLKVYDSNAINSTELTVGGIELTDVTAKRISSGKVQLTFNSSSAGSLYYLATELESINGPGTDGAGIACVAGNNIITLTEIPDKELYLELKAKNSNNMISNLVRLKLSDVSQYSVQVGQVNLFDEEYTTDGQSTTTTKPESGGYAHFENGVLTLNNFTYSGGGVSPYAAIYCECELTIKVEGENSITRKVVAGEDTDNEIVLRGIWVRSGELKIIGDNKEDFLEVIVNGHDNTPAYAVNGNSEGVVIENCTLKAKSATGGAGLYVAGDVSITGAEVLSSSGRISVNQDTFGIYAVTLKVKDSDVVAVAENNSNDGANGLWIAGSTGRLIFESGSIVAETSDVSDDSYAIHIATEDVTLPAKYWMRTSASGDFAEGTWYGANVGPYIELTTSKQSGSITNISNMDKVYDGSAVEAPTVNALSTGAKTFKYKVKGADDSTYTTEAPTNAGEYTCLITVAADDNYTEATATKDFIISKATPTAPTTPVGVITTFINTADGKITGVTSEMEYRKEGETAYTVVTGTEITGLAPGKYYVRYAQKVNYNPSPDNVITILEGPKRTPNIDTEPTASRVIIGSKLSDSILTGGVASVDGEFAWVNPDAVMNTAGKIDMLVRFTPTDTSTYNTAEFDVDVTVVICDTESGEHDFQWVIDKEPTATEEGLKHEECIVCKAKQNENTAIQKTEYSSPETGDNSDVLPMLMLLFAGVMVLAGTALLGIKKRNN